MMTCREVYGFLDDFLDGVLDHGTRLSFSAHLMLCAACRNYLATYKASIRTAREAENDEASTQVPEELVAIILASRGGPTPEPKAQG